MDYGKCACTFLDTFTGRAVRIAAREDARSCIGGGDVPAGLDKNATQREAYKVMPDGELFVIQEVVVDIHSQDKPGPPVSRTVCAICSEGINDRREVRVNGQVVCRACGQGGYYYPVHCKDKKIH